jgi:tetratricopeptide (TPR) repeat protein
MMFAWDRSHRLMAVAVFLAACAVYAGTLSYDFTWDDAFILLHIEQSFDLKGFAAPFTSEYTRIDVPIGYYRPLPFLLSHLNALLPGGASAFHLVNILLHGLNATLLFWLIARVTLSSRAAFWGALLFALHPVQAETVASISNRSELLAALFCLSSTLLWLRVRQEDSGRGRSGLLLAGVFYLLAGLAKETALLLPAALLAWDLAEPPPGAAPWRKRNLPWLLAWSGALAAALSLRWGWAHIGLGFIGSSSAGRFGRWGATALFFPLPLLTHLRLLTLPLGSSFFLTLPQIGLSWKMAAGTLMTLGTFFLASFRARPRLGWVGLAWSLIFLLPSSGLVPIGGAPAAGRFLYLPALGFALAAGWVVERACRRWSPLRVQAVVLVLAGAMAAQTAAHHAAWKDDVTIFSHIVRAAPEHYVGHLGLATALANRGRYAEAAAELDKAIPRLERLGRSPAQACTDKAVLLHRMQRFAESVETCRVSLALRPDDPLTLEILALGYLKLSLPEKALEAALSPAARASGRPAFARIETEARRMLERAR